MFAVLRKLRSNEAIRGINQGQKVKRYFAPRYHYDRFYKINFTNASKKEILQ
jgi:hypothetical protein